MTKTKLPDANTHFTEIGKRLRAHRTGRGLTPEALASRLGISRAALYRAEKGEIAKIEMLTAISKELAVSLPTLLGVGIEYLPNAPAFFERMRQLEENCNQIIGVFSPVSYLLTSDNYEGMLHKFLKDAPGTNVETIETTLRLLKTRKENFRKRKPLIASIVSIPSLQGFLQGHANHNYDVSEEEQKLRQDAAVEEVRHIAGMLRDQPIGVQIGVARVPIPSTSFQIMRSDVSAALTISPFRLGQQPNIGIGVGLVTQAPEALKLHEEIAQTLWDNSLKGAQAAAEIDRLIERAAES